VLQSPPLEAHNVLVVPHQPIDLRVFLTGGPHPVSLPRYVTAHGLSIHWCSSQLRVGSGTICNAPTSLDRGSYQLQFQESSTGLTYHHKPFRDASTSLTCCFGNFPGGHLSQDCSSSSMLNCGVLKSELTEKKGAPLVI